MGLRHALCVATPTPTRAGLFVAAPPLWRPPHHDLDLLCAPRARPRSIGRLGRPAGRSGLRPGRACPVPRGLLPGEREGRPRGGSRALPEDRLRPGGRRRLAGPGRRARGGNWRGAGRRRARAPGPGRCDPLRRVRPARRAALEAPRPARLARRGPPDRREALRRQPAARRAPARPARRGRGHHQHPRGRRPDRRGAAAPGQPRRTARPDRHAAPGRGRARRADRRVPRLVHRPGGLRVPDAQAGGREQRPRPGGRGGQAPGGETGAFALERPALRRRDGRAREPAHLLRQRRPAQADAARRAPAAGPGRPGGGHGARHARRRQPREPRRSRGRRRPRGQLRAGPGAGRGPPQPGLQPAAPAGAGTRDARARARGRGVLPGDGDEPQERGGAHRPRRGRPAGGERARPRPRIVRQRGRRGPFRHARPIRRRDQPAARAEPRAARQRRRALARALGPGPGPPVPGDRRGGARDRAPGRRRADALLDPGRSALRLLERRAPGARLQQGLDRARARRRLRALGQARCGAGDEPRGPRAQPDVPAGRLPGPTWPAWPRPACRRRKPPRWSRSPLSSGRPP